jgi:hypothetical protein
MHLAAHRAWSAGEPDSLRRRLTGTLIIRLIGVAESFGAARIAAA